MATEFVNEWMSRIKRGVKYRKQYGKSDDWREHERMYRGDWRDNITPVNKMFSYVRSMIPRVYFGAPRVSVTATRPEMVWHAKVVEAIDNMLIREAMLKDTLKMACLDGLLCGTGVIKLGYDSEYGYTPAQSVLPDGETVTQVSRKTGERIEYRSYVKPGMPWAARVHPLSIVVPWGASDPNSLSWIAHYVLRPLRDVKEDQKYRNTGALVGTRTPMQKLEGEQHWRGPDHAEEEYAELWEIRDFRAGRVYVICEDKLLLDQEDELQIEALPYEFVIFNRDPEYFWGIPDARIIAPRQRELNEVKSQISQHRRILLIKYLYRRGAIREDQLQAFLSGVVGPAVAVEEDVEVLANAIMELKPTMPQELYHEALTIIQDMREELGFGTNQAGQISPYHGKTATESMIVEQAFELRIDERKDIVADVLVNIVRKWNQFIFKFWTEERVIRIVSPQGEPFWMRYTGDELAGEYHLHIDPDSAIPMTRMLKYQLTKELFQLLGGDPMIDQMLLRKMLLNHYASVDPLADQLLKPVPPAAEMPLEDVAAQMRQPHPAGVGRTGRMAAGVGGSPTNPISIEEMRRKMLESGRA